MDLSIGYVLEKFSEIQEVSMDDPKTAITMGQILLSEIDKLNHNDLSLNITSLRNQIERSIKRIRKESGIIESEIRHIRRLAGIT